MLRQLCEPVSKVQGHAEQTSSGSGAGNAPEIADGPATSQLELVALKVELHRQQSENSLLQRRLVRLEAAITRARALTHYDELTALPNRRLLHEHFRKAAARAKRARKYVALLFIDVDRFKRINDTLGHARGDRLLQRVAFDLVAAVRGSDTACRLGGDEFVVLLADQEGRESATAAADHIRARLAAPYLCDGTEIRVNVSIGIALYPVDGETVGELLRCADGATHGTKPRYAKQPFVLDSRLVEWMVD